MGGRSATHTHAPLARPTPPSDQETSPRKDTPPGWVGWALDEEIQEIFFEVAFLHYKQSRVEAKAALKIHDQ